MAIEAFLVNPPARVRRHGKLLRRTAAHIPRAEGREVTKRGRHQSERALNPIGETLVTIGANPKAGGTMHYFSHRRHHAHNPLETGLSGAMDVRHWAPLAVTGALSAAAAGAVPGLVGISGSSWMGYGARLAVAFGGGLLVNRFVDKAHGSVWAVVGVSLVAWDLLKTYVFSMFPQLGLSGVGAYQNYNLRDESQAAVAAFPTSVGDAGGYPDRGGMQAFPLGEVSEVGSYPYDGTYGSYDTTMR